MAAVPGCDGYVFVNRGDQFGNTSKDAATNTFLRDVTEESFNHGGASSERAVTSDSSLRLQSILTGSKDASCSLFS